MKDTIQRILWGALILVWGGHFGASFIVLRESTPYSAHAYYIVGLVAAVIVLVGIALLTYRFARKNNSEDPIKAALIVATIISLILGILFWAEPYLPNWF